jgi:hypothetical protein
MSVYDTEWKDYGEFIANPVGGLLKCNPENHKMRLMIYKHGESDFDGESTLPPATAKVDH